MNDSMPTSPAVGATPLPVIRFNPALDPLPAVVAEAGGPGALVLLVDAATDRTWAAETVVALASGWAAAGRRVVLADLHLEDPVLHERLGEPNLDGVVDIFLYGASLARSARPVEGHGFYLIPAGTYAPDAAAVYRHPRWAKLVAGFRDADAMLLLFMPGSAVEAAVLGEWTRGAIVLGARDGSALAEALQAAGVPLRAALLPRPLPVAAADADHTLEAGVPVPLPAAVLGTVAPGGAFMARAPATAPTEPEIEAPLVEEQELEAREIEPQESEVLESEVLESDHEPGEPADLAEAPELTEPDWFIAPPEPLEPGVDEPTLESAGESAAQPPAEPWSHFAEALAPEPWEEPAAPHDHDEAGASFGGADAPDEVVPIEPAPAAAPPPLLVEREEAPVVDPLEAIPEGVVVRRRRRRRGPLLLLWAGVGVVALGVAAYLLVTSRPEWFRGLGGEAAVPADSLLTVDAAGAAAPTSAPAAPVPAGEALPYAVQVKAFTTLAGAQQQIAADARRYDRTLFYVSPEREQGILYYKVRAGLLADTIEATRLRQALVVAGVIDADDAAGTWSLIQYAPFAFVVGDFADGASASARADSLAAGGIATYAVEVPYSDGSSRWRLYAGAYRDSTRAEAMRELFERAALETPPLVERVGKAAGQDG